MRSYKQTSIFIDSLLKILVSGGVLATSLSAPNAIQAFDGPLKMFFKKMDKRSLDREYKHLLVYMKKQGLIDYKPYNFSGIRLTEAGIKRANKADLEAISIPTPKKWDKNWRIVFFDIPEEKRVARNALTLKLKSIGFIPLQKSVWIHPYPCRDEIAAISEQYEIRKYITYIETSYIDSHTQLAKIFSDIL